MNFFSIFSFLKNKKIRKEQNSPIESTFQTPFKIHRKSNTLHLPSRRKDYVGGEILNDTFLILGEIEEGIEPKYLVVELDEDLVQLVNKINQESITDVVTLISSIKTDKQQAQNIASNIKNYLQKNKDESIKMWIIKQDYKEPKFLKEHVSPGINRLANSDTVKKQNPFIRVFFVGMYAAYKTINGRRLDVNMNAYLEYVATRVASKVYGLKTPEIRCVKGEYEDGFPKIGNAIAWEPGLKTFDRCLEGAEDHKKYLVHIHGYEDKEPILYKANGYFYSDNTIENLGYSYIPLIAMNDPDKNGSHGQNNGEVEKSLFVFDLGQAYRHKNKLVHKLDDDFSIKTPYDTFIKNISIFTDTPITEKMVGVFIFYYISDKKTKNELFNLEEQKIINAALEQYKNEMPNFAKILENLNEGAEEKEFTYCKEKLKNLIHNHKEDVIAVKAYEEYLNKLNQIKKEAFNTRVQILKTFKERLHYSPSELELVDNLEKLCMATSALSPNAKVILNHLRKTTNETHWLKSKLGLEKNNRIRWVIKKENNNITLEAKIPKKQVNDFKNLLNDYLDSLGKTDSRMKLQVSSKNGMVYFKYPTASLNELKNLFNEDSIKKYKSKIDPINHPQEAMPEALPEAIQKIKKEFAAKQAVLVETYALESQEQTLKEEAGSKFQSVEGNVDRPTKAENQTNTHALMPDPVLIYFPENTDPLNLSWISNKQETSVVQSPVSITEVYHSILFTPPSQTPSTKREKQETNEALLLSGEEPSKTKDIKGAAKLSCRRSLFG